MDLSLFFAGTAGSVPTARRGLPAMLLRAGGDRLLFDCGEGTQQQLLRSIGLPELDAIFLTHYHLDHWLGLIGMLKTFDLRARERPLTVYGPPGLKALFATLRPVFGRTAYPLTLIELEPHEEVRFDGYVDRPFPVKHRVEAYGYAFVEDERPGRFDVEAARRLGVTHGPGLRPPAARRDGRRRRPGAGGRRRPRPGRRIVLSGDTAPCQAVEVLAHRGRPARARGDLPRGRARPRARDRPLDRPPGGGDRPRRGRAPARADPPLHPLLPARRPRRGARASSPTTVVPRDFDAIEVPFPERGEPGAGQAGPRARAGVSRRASGLPTAARRSSNCR